MSTGRPLPIQSRRMGLPKPRNYPYDSYRVLRDRGRTVETFRAEVSVMTLAYDLDTLDRGLYYQEDSYTVLIFRELCNTNSLEHNNNSVYTTCMKKVVTVVPLALICWSATCWADVEFRDRANILTEQDRTTLQTDTGSTLDLHILTDAHPTSSDAVLTEAKEWVTTPKTLVIAIDVQASKVHVRYGKDLRIPESKFDEIGTSGNPYFHEKNWVTGFTTVTANTKKVMAQATTSTEPSPCDPLGYALLIGFLGLIVMGCYYTFRGWFGRKNTPRVMTTSIFVEHVGQQYHRHNNNNAYPPSIPKAPTITQHSPPTKPKYTPAPTTPSPTDHHVQTHLTTSTTTHHTCSHHSASHSYDHGGSSSSYSDGGGSSSSFGDGGSSSSF